MTDVESLARTITQAGGQFLDAAGPPDSYLLVVVACPDPDDPTEYEFSAMSECSTDIDGLALLKVAHRYIGGLLDRIAEGLPYDVADPRLQGDGP